MNNMGLIDHPLTPLIMAWLVAVNRRTMFSTKEAHEAEIAARKELNTALAIHSFVNERKGT